MDQYQASNDKFVDGIKKIYKGRALLYDSVQWPPVRGDKLIKLELVETEKASGFLNQELQRQIRSPILKRDIFSASKSGRSQVKIVVIEGIAGIGKTTLCKMLTEEWAAGEIFNSFEIVLLLPLREEGVSSASSFLDILAELYPSLDSNYMLTRITENQGEGILIIADGWDELRVKNREANSFLYKLLICQRVLPFASVILTSRPTASAILHSHSSVDRFIEVVGFSEENIRNFIQSEIADPSQCLSLLNQLEINPLLLSICTIPFNCSIVCNLWHTRKQKLPDTLTELYTLLVKNIVRRDVNKKFQKVIISSLSSFDCIPDHNENFWQICRFAFQCLTQDQLTFSDKVFPDFFSNDDKMFFGLLQPATTLSCDGNKLSFHFIHLTVQEYLAALHVATLSPQKRKHIITQNADNSRFFTLWRFMFGLGGNQNSEVTSRRIENLSEQEVLNLIQSLNPSSDSLLLSQYAFESNDVIITQKIARIIRGVFTKATGSIARSPYDCAAICNVLQYTTTEVCDHMFLNISNCGLSEKMLMEMTDNICRGALSVPPIVSVHLDNNNLPEEAINDMLVRCSKQFFNLEALSLAGNKLSKFFIIPLTNLTVLSLSNNPLGVEGIQLLEEAIAETQLNKLQWLDLANTLVADADINGALLTSLLNCLLVHSPDLVQLDISENNLNIPGACALGEAVNMYGNRKKENYLEININHTNLSDEAFSALALAEALNLYGNRQNENYLEINMNHTNLSDEAFSAFVHCAVSNQTVSKGKNCLKLVLHIAKNPNLASITLLHQLLYCNGLVIALNFERTGIFSTKVEHDHTYSSIQQATVNTSLSWLVLDGNKLNGNHMLLAEVLVACRSLSLLSLQKCSITTQDLRKLNECLIKSSIDAHVLNFWDLSSNNIDDQGITFLKNEIHNFFPSLLVVRAIDNPVKDHTNLENVLQFMLINLNVSCLIANNNSIL